MFWRKCDPKTSEPKILDLILAFWQCAGLCCKIKSGTVYQSLKRWIVRIIKTLSHCKFMGLCISSKSLRFNELLTHVQYECSMKPVLITHRTDNLFLLDYQFLLSLGEPWGDDSCFYSSSAPQQWQMWYHSAPRLHIPTVAAIFKGCDVIPVLWPDTAGSSDADT